MAPPITTVGHVAICNASKHSHNHGEEVDNAFSTFACPMVQGSRYYVIRTGVGEVDVNVPHTCELLIRWLDDSPPLHKRICLPSTHVPGSRFMSSEWDNDREHEEKVVFIPPDDLPKTKWVQMGTLKRDGRVVQLCFRKRCARAATDITADKLDYYYLHKLSVSMV